ncbi:MAG: hypothetical protein ACWA41_00355 [Putridiphycobacter sp.]
MKKVIVLGTFGVFALGIVSCGGGHSCDAYRKADYTKYKAKKEIKMKLNKTLKLKK